MRKRLTWLAVTVLTACILALSLAAHDRSHLELVVILVVAGSACGLMLWYLNALTVRAVLFYAVLFRLALLHLPPSLSDDAYRYVWDGQVQAHGINPYQYVPQDPALEFLQDGALYDHLNSPAFYSVYPPVSQLIFGAAAHLFDGNWWAIHYTIKLVFVLAELLAVFILARLVASRHLILYALNPWILLETAGQAHTESLLILLFVLAVFFHGKGRGAMVSATLGLAGWVKLFPFFFLPLLWRRYRWRGILPGLVTASLLAFPFAAPFVISNVAESLDLYVRYFEFNAGPYYAAKEFMRLWTGDDWSKQLGPLMRTLFLIGLPVIYAVDYRYKRTLLTSMLVITASYLLFSTTVHPWYILSIVVMLVLAQLRAWHWLWLGLCSVGTYLLYAGGPYWSFVIAGWGGWVVLGILHHQSTVLQWILKLRAKRKYRFIRKYINRHTQPLAVIDLGCAEGYVGEQVYCRRHAQVVLADIVDMNRSKLPFERIAPGRLPWSSEHFDTVVLYFVLHHTQQVDLVVQEALRVCKQQVVIVESVYRSELSLQVLTFLDKLANRIRSWGRMTNQEPFLKFRTSEAWAHMFGDLGGRLVAHESAGYGPFRKAVFVVRPNGQNLSSPATGTRDTA